MRLVTFVEPYYQHERIGFIQEGKGGSYVVDANLAYSLLKAREGEAFPQSVADRMIPTDMVELLRSGKSSMNAVREVEKFAAKKGPAALEKLNGRRTAFRSKEVKLKAPVPRPGKILH